MAFKNKEIDNPKTGQSIKFLQTSKETDGALLEMESTFSSFSKEPPAHYHPYQVEIFTVVTGELTVRVSGDLKTLKSGEKLHIAPQIIHSMWNNSGSKTIVNWKVRPALDTEYLLETSAALAQQNKTNEDGRPSLLQTAVMLQAFSNVFRLAKPTYAIQKIIFVVLTPIAYLIGLRPTYQKYLD